MLFFFFFNDTATTEIYTLSLHDALPIWVGAVAHGVVDEVHEDLLQPVVVAPHRRERGVAGERRDRKSTRLNSSHANISYAVFCLKKKKNNKTIIRSIQKSPIS